MTASVKSYSMLTNPLAGTTNTGLDQFVDVINSDQGLAGSNLGSEIAAGASAANTLNTLIVQAVTATGAGGNGATKVFTAADVVAIHNWIVSHVGSQWNAAHGVGTSTTETGFYLVQGDGGTTRFHGESVIDTIEAGIYQLGNTLSAGKFLNQDGTPGVSTDKVAGWLTQFYTDHSTTNTGLDHVTDRIFADNGLSSHLSPADLAEGVEAADGIFSLIADGIEELGLADDGHISAEDVLAIDDWIYQDTFRYNFYLEQLGVNDDGEVTGIQLLLNKGATSTIFCEGLVDSVAKGMFTVGFDYSDDGKFFVDEDGNPVQSVAEVADWLTYFYTDQSTTGTGLDRIVDAIKADTGLSRYTDAGQIVGGADAANGLNQLIADAIEATGADADGWITIDDLYKMNAWIRADDDRYAHFLELHGDDEDGEETGFHQVQGDGGSTQYFGRDLINTVADGMYHIGFEIEDGRFLNEDGDANQSLSDVSAWLNYFYSNKVLTVGTDGADKIVGTNASQHITTGWGDDSVDAGGAADLIYGGWGNDTLNGGSGNDLLYGEGGRDKLDGGQDSDIYRVTGNEAGGWSSFGDYDTYKDTGTTGTDRIEAVGPGDVDIGMMSFNAASGIEVIDATGAGGDVRILGDWDSNLLDFRATTFVGAITIDGGYGNDTIYGTAGDDTIVGSGGNDRLDGAGGSDTYLVTGNEGGGWESFGGHDTYADTGTSGVDTIVALGDGDVDIGLTRFGPTSGIEQIDGSGAEGTVRLLGDWNGNTLDFRTTTFIGGNIVIDGGYGDDKIYGTVADDTIIGAGGNDLVDGGAGSDRYEVRGNEAGGWESFEGYDSYADSGASGVDTIVAIGMDDVDVGLKKFGSTSRIEVIDGSETLGTVRLLGDWNGNTLDFRSTTFVGGNIVIDGGYGDDKIYGTADDDTIIGGGGNDALDGREGSDTYIVTGNEAGGWESYQGNDAYRDTGASGTDAIVAQGDDDVDIGLQTFGPDSGIELIDGSEAMGDVRLLGDWNGNLLDFSETTITGGNVVIDGGYGNDTIIGTLDDDTIVGGGGDDDLDGGEGSDTYIVRGNEAGGWSSFAGTDTYLDTGVDGTDTIVAMGVGNVDIGFNGFDADSGIEVIDTTGATGVVRLLGDWGGNTLDFSSVTILGSKAVIDGNGGNDEITGSSTANVIVGGIGDDWMDGGNGGDTYRVYGNVAGGWSSFSGYDTYADSGVSGTDTIKAMGSGNVDIGLDGFDSDSGIEIIDSSGAKGAVRIVGGWSGDTFDFSSVTFTGKTMLIDAGGGDDIIIGTAGVNRMTGGEGNDELTGGLGNDAFLFNTALNKWCNVDTITDFSVPGDTIELSRLVFKKAGAVGVLTDAAFVTGEKAADASDRIIYNKSTGDIFYDADGTGKGEAILFARVDAGLNITHSDFSIV